jgi:hypothetical protein
LGRGSSIFCKKFSDGPAAINDTRLSRGFGLDLAGVGAAAREGDKVAILVVVENHARLVLVALPAATLSFRMTLRESGLRS